MFIRKKRNKSGSFSVQIIDKSGGKYRVTQTIGSSRNPDKIKRLMLQAEQIINKPHPAQEQLIPVKSKKDLVVENFIQGLSNANIRTIGPELIFGKLFDRIGFNIIPNEIFRHITIARLAYPSSKLKTADYLFRYKGIEVGIQTIYRFLDILHSAHKDKVERIAYEHTKNTLKNISVVFYDMTTLYFEAEDEDDLRKIGFSKDGKFQKPQIMLGLLVGQNGYPIGYDLFEGNTAEVKTLIPVLEQIQKKYDFPKPIVIADAGLLSKNNLQNLRDESYQFILGARIKNESDNIKNQILTKANKLKDGDSFTITKSDGLRLVITYSDKRARKDAYNRERGLKKLRLRVKSGKLTKESINNRGYNKFLHLKNEVRVEIEESKIRTDTKWDGLKGYVTNTRLRSKAITENYRHLWQIEKAFRISKTDLRIRPIFHRIEKRIEAHICIAFVAYTIYKELERLLMKHKVNISPKRASELTHNMYQLECVLPESSSLQKVILKMDQEQQLLYDVIYDN